MSHFIIENAIYQEAEIVKKLPQKAIFRMTLQTADDKNRNRRIYPKKVLTEGLEECRDRMSRRAFFGEMDHPVPTGNRDFDMIRQTTVSLKEVSHIIRDYEFQGNRLVGELETTRTKYGKDLLGLLLDKVGVGMSLRGMGEIERNGDINIVGGPLLVISYDSVSAPSHTAAIVDFKECTFESHMLTEHIICESNDVVCVGDQCYLANYFDKLVESKVYKFFDKWI